MQGLLLTLVLSATPHAAPPAAGLLPAVAPVVEAPAGPIHEDGGEFVPHHSHWQPQTCYAPRFGCYYGNDRHMHRYPAFHGYHVRKPYNYRHLFQYPWHAGLHEPTSMFAYNIEEPLPAGAVAPPAAVAPPVGPGGPQAPTKGITRRPTATQVSEHSRPRLPNPRAAALAERLARIEGELAASEAAAIAEANSLRRGAQIATVERLPAGAGEPVNARPFGTAVIIQGSGPVLNSLGAAMDTTPVDQSVIQDAGRVDEAAPAEENHLETKPIETAAGHQWRAKLK